MVYLYSGIHFQNPERVSFRVFYFSLLRLQENTDRSLNRKQGQESLQENTDRSLNRKQGQESLLEDKNRSLYWKTRTEIFTGKQGQESLQENKARSLYRKQGQ